MRRPTRNPGTGGFERLSANVSSGMLATSIAIAEVWRFTEITPNSFHWPGEALAPDGNTWTLAREFRAKRIR